MGGGAYMMMEVGEWLAEKISWLGKGYGDRKYHENRLKRKVLCRSCWIVISSL